MVRMTRLQKRRRPRATAPAPRRLPPGCLHRVAGVVRVPLPSLLGRWAWLGPGQASPCSPTAPDPLLGIYVAQETAAILSLQGAFEQQRLLGVQGSWQLLQHCKTYVSHHSAASRFRRADINRAQAAGTSAGRLGDDGESAARAIWAGGRGQPVTQAPRARVRARRQVRVLQRGRLRQGGGSEGGGGQGCSPTVRLPQTSRALITTMPAASYADDTTKYCQGRTLMLTPLQLLVLMQLRFVYHLSKL